MNDLEDYLLSDKEPAELSVDGLIEASNFFMELKKPMTKEAMISRLVRGTAHSSQKSGRSAMSTLNAIKAGMTDEAPKGVKGLLSKLPSKRIKVWAGDSEAVARSKGPKYFRAWQEGRDIKRTIDPGGLAFSMNKSVRNAEGNVTAGSLVQGLDDTGVLPTSVAAGSTYKAMQGLKKARADRIASKKMKKNLLAGGAVGGTAALLLARKRAEKNA